MKIVNREEVLVLMDNEIEVESYSLNSEIKFEKLVQYLLNKNLSKKVENEINVSNYENAEFELVNIIFNLLENYNEKVNELDKFKMDNKSISER